MLKEREYERRRALEYARRWAYGRNPLFYNFTGIGGDCTNSVSYTHLPLLREFGLYLGQLLGRAAVDHQGAAQHVERQTHQGKGVHRSKAVLGRHEQRHPAVEKAGHHSKADGNCDGDAEEQKDCHSSKQDEHGHRWLSLIHI